MTWTDYTRWNDRPCKLFTPRLPANTGTPRHPATMSVNKVILVGRLGANPELKSTQSGTSVCNMRLATNRSWTDKSGQRQEETEWHTVTAWGKTAEICDQYLSKGRQVYVEGRIQTNEWEDRDGNTRYTTEIVANNVTFLSGGGGSQGPGPSKGPQGQGGAPTDSWDEDDVPF